MADSIYFNQSNYIPFLLSDPPEKLISLYNACKVSDFIYKPRDISLFLDELIS